MVAPLLAAKGLARRYGAVEALKPLDLEIRAGDVLGICGDNGAGKSTLIRLLSGADRPSAGTLALDGAEMDFRSPSDALERGVATIYQDLALTPGQAIYQNVFMGAELVRGPAWLGWLDKPRMRDEARRYLARLDFKVADMNRPVSALSGGQRQAVAIARALRWSARLVIMDEPTAALGVAESAQVMELIRMLNGQGVTIVLISHNMDEVVAVTNRILVMKGGRKVGELATAGTTPDRIAHAITTGSLERAA